MMQLTSLLGEIVSRDKDLTIQILIQEIERLKATIIDLERKPGFPAPPVRQGAQAIEVNGDRISADLQPDVERFMGSANQRFSQMFGLDK